MNTSETLLTLTNLTKSYGAANVLNGIDLTLRKGEILGLVGENGAGKSTLAKCIAGNTDVTSGTIAFADADTRIYTIPQEFNLIPDLAVYENIFLGREMTAHGFLNRRAMIARSAELLGRLKSTLDPERPVRSLSVAEKQMVEIAKAFLFDCALLIMDEPSTVLNHQETALMFENMRNFRSHGGAIIYISHKLEEVRTICDSIAILRDGVLVAQVPARELSAQEIAQKMVGRELSKVFPEKIRVPDDAPVALEVRHLSSADGTVKDVSFSLRQGELLGIAGLAGAGRTELAETICALRKKATGDVLLFGEAQHFAKPADAMAAGLSYLSEDRQGTAVLTDFSVTFNTTLASLAKYCKFSFVDTSAADSATRAYIEKFRIKTPSPDATLSRLSGGNQQKVAIAKGLDTLPRVFIFDEPTRGVDVGARGDIYRFIHDLVRDGVSCIMISSDLEEVIGNCARVLVMRGGTVSGELRGDAVTEEEIMYLATGVSA